MGFVWDNKGQNSQSTVIIFIAIMVISTLVAGTIMTLNNHAKNKAIEVEQETEKRVTTRFDVIKIEGYGGEDKNIDEIWVYAKLTGGSQPIQLKNVMILFDTKDFASELLWNNNSYFDTDDIFINSDHATLKPDKIMSNESEVYTRNDYNGDFIQDNISIFTNCSDYNWTTCSGVSPSGFWSGYTYSFIPPSFPNTPPGFITDKYYRSRIYTQWDNWVCEYWIYLQSKSCNHQNITYTTDHDNITCVTNITYENSFSSTPVINYLNQDVPSVLLNQVTWFFDTDGNNNNYYNQDFSYNLNVKWSDAPSNTVSYYWSGSTPTQPPAGVPEGIFRWRKDTRNITTTYIANYTNITTTTITNISNCTLNHIYNQWNETIGCYEETTQNNFTFRYDDNVIEQFGFGNDSNSGISKWILVNNAQQFENFTLKLYGRADYCNETSSQSYRIRVNDVVGQTLNINWCDEFNLDINGPLQNSSYAWMNFSIQESWLQNGENKFNLWDTSDENISNWRIGFDTDTSNGRSGYCNGCGTDPIIGQEMAAREAMIYLTAINYTTQTVNCSEVQHWDEIGNFTTCDTKSTKIITLNQITNRTRTITTNITFNDTINNTLCSYFSLVDIVDGPHPQPPVCGPFGIGCSYFDVDLSNGSSYLVSMGTNLRDCALEDDPATVNVTEAPCTIDVDYFMGQANYPFSVDIHAHGVSTTRNTFDNGVDFYTVFKDSNKIWMGKYTTEVYEKSEDYRKNYVTYGDIYLFRMFVPAPIGEGDKFKIKFAPYHGTVTDIDLIAPGVIVTDRVKLFPKN
jgi:archaellin